jgi:thymidine phosphorylase
MTAPRFMTAEEYRGTVDAIVRNRSEEAEYQAAALATAVAFRIDARVRELDGLTMAYLRAGRRAA